jgi:hypothetical protein
MAGLLLAIPNLVALDLPALVAAADCATCAYHVFSPKNR